MDPTTPIRTFGIPMVLFVAVLVLFGIVWMFNHHHWKPVFGILLFVLGVGFFVFAGYFATRVSLRQDYAHFATQEAVTQEAERMRQSNLERERVTSDRERKQADAAPRLDSNSAGKSAEAATISSPPTASASPPSAPRRRPDWLGRALHRTSLDNGQQVFETGVSSGPYLTEAECERAIILAINDAVNKYVADYIPEATGQEIVLEPDYVNSQLVKDTYWETVNSTVAPMNQLHALLVFDSQVRGDLIDRAREATVGGRLHYAAAGTALALALLGGIYSLLKRGAPRGTPVINR